uniref:Uncharacterized protein n=1 Tax=Rhizophora mucronata TaxID=61149 RepID=A0A2P2QQL6_RHIMU
MSLAFPVSVHLSNSCCMSSNSSTTMLIYTRFKSA